MTHAQTDHARPSRGAQALRVANKRLLSRLPTPIFGTEGLRTGFRRAAVLGQSGLSGIVRVSATLCAVALTVMPGGVQAQDMAQRYNDYPTAARADYVFACMATNGRSRLTLEKCSCSIDEIASILPYEKYLQAETVLSMRRTGGERMAVFNSAVAAQNLVTDLRRAQAEAEVVCF